MKRDHLDVLGSICIAAIWAFSMVFAAQALSQWKGFIQVNQEYSTNMLKNSTFKLEADDNGAPTAVRMDSDGITTKGAENP